MLLLHWSLFLLMNVNRTSTTRPLQVLPKWIQLSYAPNCNVINLELYYFFCTSGLFYITHLIPCTGFPWAFTLLFFPRGLSHELCFLFLWILSSSSSQIFPALWAQYLWLLKHSRPWPCCWSCSFRTLKSTTSPYFQERLIQWSEECGSVVDIICVTQTNPSFACFSRIVWGLGIN